MGADLSSLNRWRPYIVVAGLVVLFILSQRSGVGARQAETCAAVNEVKATLVSYIDAQLNRSSKSIPTIDYYKQHPVELGRALANLERQRQATHEAFAPTDC